MLRFKRQETTLEGISIDEIRRQIGIGLMTIFTVVGFITITLSFNTDIAFTTQTSLAGYLIPALGLVTLFMLYRRILVRVVLYVPLILFLGVMVLSSVEQSFIAVLFAASIYAALITRLPVYGSISIFMVIMAVLHQQAQPEVSYILFAIIAIVLGVMVFYAIDNFSSITSSASRTNQLLRASSNIGQVINRELELQQLLDNTVNIIRDEFDYYHVQVFLTDDKHEFANLVASTGEAGQHLLARNHRLPVGSQSVIGRVSQVGEPVVTQNTSADKVHALNELLPETRAELALPLIESGNIIGALDVQSVRADAFQSIDIQALQIIANQLAVAVRNARLFDQAQQNIQENKRLLFEYETNLREVDRLNRTLTKQSWGNYLAQAYVDGVTLAQDHFAPDAEWSDAMRAATRSLQTHIATSDDTQVIAVPVVLRGQVLGAIEVEFDASANTAETIEMIEAISQRLATSLESARLFEEAQEASLQEQQINEIVSSYETAVTIDELLQVTLEKLQQSLGAEKGMIRLGMTDTNGAAASHSHNGNGGTPS